MRFVCVLTILLSLFSCQTIEKEPATSSLINIPANYAYIKVLPKPTKGINYTNNVWVDFAVEFESNPLLQVKNVKFVDSSNPESTELTKKSLEALNHWVFSSKNIKDYAGKRYLLRVPGNKF